MAWELDLLQNSRLNSISFLPWSLRKDPSSNFFPSPFESAVPSKQDEKASPSLLTSAAATATTAATAAAAGSAFVASAATEKKGKPPTWFYFGANQALSADAGAVTWSHSRVWDCFKIITLATNLGTSVLDSKVSEKLLNLRLFLESS